MKKILVLLSLILILGFVSANISLFNAQDTAKNYLLENEMIDSYSQQKISCDENKYFVIPVVNSLSETSFFVPISNSTGEVYISKTDSDNLDLIKSAYVLKQLSYSNSGNYLTSQLVDRIDRLISTLDSKNSRLEGIIDGDYSYEVKQEVTVTKNKLSVLRNTLVDIKENLNSLLENQNEFLYSPSCESVDSLLSDFSNAFEGYRNLNDYSLEYKSSVEDVTKTVVADDDLDDIKKRSILNFVEAPSNLNSEITLIYDSLSSTSSFYNKIVSDTYGTTGEENIKIYIDNFISRQNLIKVNSMLTSYDSDFPEYDNLEQVIDTILDPNYKSYWKEQEDVTELKAVYSDIKQIKDSGTKTVDNTTVVLNKIKKAKALSSNILSEGYIEFEESTPNAYYYAIGAVILILIILLIYFGKKKSKKKPKKKKEEYMFDKEEISPFD